MLTSLDQGDLRGHGLRGRTSTELVLSRARRALDLGCDGVVSSGLEAHALRESLGEKLLIVTPGIRPAENRPADDQKRVVTVEQALAQRRRLHRRRPADPQRPRSLPGGDADPGDDRGAVPLGLKRGHGLPWPGGGPWYFDCQEARRKAPGLQGRHARLGRLHSSRRYANISDILASYPCLT